MGAFTIKRYDVTVEGYGSGTYLAPSRGRAIADAWRSASFDSIPFGKFLKICRARRTPTDQLPSPFGDPITVAGAAAFFVDRNRQYVQFVRPDSGVVMNSHPYDVEPEHYRPDTYRNRK
jgi:hypothetical protein